MPDFANFNYIDQADLLYDFNIEHNVNKVVITTDDMPISAIVKLLLEKEAKIEIYSAHAHPGRHGR